MQSLLTAMDQWQKAKLSAEHQDDIIESAPFSAGVCRLTERTLLILSDRATHTTLMGYGAVQVHLRLTLQHRE